MATWLYFTRLDSTTLYCASTWLYLILHAQLYITLYYGSTWLYLTPLDSTTLYHGSILEFTIHFTMALLNSITLYHVSA